jgi:hypothetical protein
MAALAGVVVERAKAVMSAVIRRLPDQLEGAGN